MRFPSTPLEKQLLGIILLLSLTLNSVGLAWGLPNGTTAWSIDGYNALAPLQRVKQAWWDEAWNSGWFHYKYPLGHAVTVSIVQLPYMAWLRTTGQFQSPSSTYPYGFQDPERALTVLMLLMRGVSVLMAVGSVALLYVIASMLFGSTAGLAASLLLTGCYPFVYAAHMSNLDAAVLFWSALAVAAALISADRSSVRWAAIAGLAAGMGLFTKEPSIGVVIALPLVWLLRRQGKGTERREMIVYAAAAGVGFLVVAVVIGNLWWNPSGFVNRWRYLMGILPEELMKKYTPYRFPTYVPWPTSLSGEIEWLARAASRVVRALTWPVALLCLAGAVWTLWSRPRQAAIPLLLAASFYVFSLRSAALMPVRYTMPLLYFLFILGGVAAGALINKSRRLQHPLARRAALALLVCALGLALLPGIEIDRLLVQDPRYAAEAWLRAHAPSDTRLEIYQELTYLPRFGSDVRVTQVPMAERTVELFQQRRPDFIVLSSAGAGQATTWRDPDWQPGKPFRVVFAPAKDFYDRLLSKELGYHPVAQFHTPTKWIKPRIASLNPKITIYAREGANVRKVVDDPRGRGTHGQP